MKIAICQTNTGIDPKQNAHDLSRDIAIAASQGAVAIFTPEMSGVLDRDRARSAPNLRIEADDVVLTAMRNAAKLNEVTLFIGSLAIAGECSDGRLVNRSFAIGSSGAIIARYDKLHLFDVALASGESWRESNAYAAGDSAVVVNSVIGPVGLSVCYDLRFAALYNALSAAGAKVLAVPAAFTVPTGRAHWHVLLRARAIENACYVIAAAQSGHHADGRDTYGHSLVIDPWGRVMLDMGDGTGIGYADIDLAEVDKARAQVPVLAHRRAIPHVTICNDSL